MTFSMLIEYMFIDVVIGLTIYFVSLSVAGSQQSFLIKLLISIMHHSLKVKMAILGSKFRRVSQGQSQVYVLMYCFQHFVPLLITAFIIAEEGYREANHCSYLLLIYSTNRDSSRIPTIRVYTKPLSEKWFCADSDWHLAMKDELNKVVSCSTEVIGPNYFILIQIQVDRHSNILYILQY